MTRLNLIPALITLAIMLASTGCGDASSFDETADGAVAAGDTAPTLEDELELACEAFCDVTASCRRLLVRDDCFESCADTYARETDDACIAAQIDRLNCYSATGCDDSRVDVRSECGEATLAVRNVCGLETLGRGREEDGDIVVIEVTDRESVDVDGDAEETEPSEGSDDEEPDESEDTGPVFELPEIPDYPEIPEIGPVLDFP